MKDTWVAFLVTSAVVAPICSVCVLGPTFLFSWLGGWFSGLSPLMTTGLSIIAAILVYGFLKRRQARICPGINRENASPFARIDADRT